ncbi:MAG: hypothetical protein KGH87_09410 [Thaumarchaeota archaeon]|nr:hypothetical protein [Nitrososphaerota archaeon]
MCPKPLNPNKLDTTIGVKKADKAILRKYVQNTNNPKRKKGKESDSEVFHRMVVEIEKHWTPTNNVPSPTYDGSKITN